MTSSARRRDATFTFVGISRRDAATPSRRRGRRRGHRARATRRRVEKQRFDRRIDAPRDVRGCVVGGVVRRRRRRGVVVEAGVWPRPRARPRRNDSWRVCTRTRWRRDIAWRWRSGTRRSANARSDASRGFVEASRVARRRRRCTARRRRLIGVGTPSDSRARRRRRRTPPTWKRRSPSSRGITRGNARCCTRPWRRFDPKGRIAPRSWNARRRRF